MIYGNMTLNSRPSESDLREEVICLCCLDECSEVGTNESFSDAFGVVEDWGVGSSCCEGETAEGKVFVNRIKYPVAKKDYPRIDVYGNPQPYILKGERYRSEYRKGYYIDEDTGEHKGFVVYKKVKIKS